jgi:non-heme chloroperoxidase
MTPRLHLARLPNGIELPYAEAGDADGTPVVLLHAYADSWRSFEEVLTRLPPSIHAIAPSQRGHGDASKPEAGYAVEDFAGDLVALLDSVRIPRAVLVASSSAVFTAERLAVEHPERVAGLVLIGVPWSIAERAPSFDFVETVRGVTDPVDPAIVRAVIEGTTSERVPREFLDAMVGESRKVPARVWQQTLTGLLVAQPPDPGVIRTPTLVIWGDRDELIPRDDQERLRAAILGSRLLVYEGAGHVVHWEQPERVAGDVAAFVAERTPDADQGSG